MINKLIKNTILLFIVGFILQACGVNSNIMFKTPKDGSYSFDSIPMRPLEEYRISKDDKISFTISNNLGHKIIDNQTGIGGINTTTITGKEMEYLVDIKGEVELPVIGKIKVENLTISACEDTLAKKYSKAQQDPFVQVKVTNQRVIVFPGQGSDARVIPLVNTNTTLMEAIAQAGGITERGKASSIKLMRKNAKNEREVYLIDLSTIEGLKYTDMIVQSNDYIYIEPDARLARETLEQIAPFITIFSSLTVILTLIFRLQ